MNTSDLNIREFLKVVRKRKSIIISFFVILFCIVLLGTLSAPPLYTASTRLIIEKAEQLLFPSQMNYYGQYDPDFYETQYQLLKSEAVANKVVEIISLEEGFDRYLADERKPYSLIAAIKRIFGGGDFPEAPAGEVDTSEGGAGGGVLKNEGLAMMIRSGISVVPEKNSRIVTVSYTSRSPDFAHTVVNAIAKAYIEQVLDMRMASSKYTLEWLKDRSAEERKKLADAERALQEYVKANDIVTLEDRITVLPQKLSALGTQLIGDRSKLNELETLYGRIKGIKDPAEADSIPAISSDPIIQTLRGDILKVEQSIGELSKVYGKKHPKMIRAMEELKALQEKKDREVSRLLGSIKTQYELARSNVEKYNMLLEETRREALELNEKFLQYEVLKKELETNRELYDVLLNKTKEEGVTEQIKTVNVWILEKARRPSFPSEPNVRRNLILATMVGFLGGVGLAFVIEHLNDTINVPEEAEFKLGIPVLGVVPRAKSPQAAIEGIVASEPSSSLAESYKSIRTAILLSSAEKPPRSLLITSMSPKEGKTATSLNLATAIMQSGRSVLLLDCDLRKPKIHKLLGLENEVGMSTYLAGASELKINKSDTLDVITSGPVPPNPSELIGSERFALLMEELKGKYDVIVLDSSPLLAISDPLILSRLVDGTVLIAKAEQSTYGALRRGLKSLADMKSHVLGMIINAVDLTHSSYYYYSYDYHSSQEERA